MADCHLPTPPACCAGVENLCLSDLDTGGGAFFGILFELALLAYSFVAVALIADEHLVVSLETLCARWNVREDVAGASFMAFGSAAPEIIINAIGTLKTVLAHDKEGGGDDTALGIGAIVGSGMIAFTFIPGCCGMATSKPLELKRRPLARDILTYLVALIVLYGAISDGKVEVGESIVMVLLYAVYLAIVVSASQVRETYRVKYLGRAARSKTSFVTQASEALASAEMQTSTGGPLPPPQPTTHQALPPVGLMPLSSVGSPMASVPEDRVAAFDGLTPLTAPSPAGSGVGGGPASGHTPSDPPMASVVVVPSSLEVAPSSSVSRLPPRLARAVETARALGSLSLRPLLGILSVTCPECAHDSPGAPMYPLTLAASFTWVAFFSTVIAAVVTRWGDLLGIPNTYLGMYVIAIGAEIPDTIQSVTVAKRGYGSMAVSNSTGSQIINILIGLGVPWLMTNAAGMTVPIPRTSVGQLHTMAGLQLANVLLYMGLLLLPTLRTWRPGDHSKASHGHALHAQPTVPYRALPHLGSPRLTSAHLGPLPLAQTGRRALAAKRASF